MLFFQVFFCLCTTRGCTPTHLTDMKNSEFDQLFIEYIFMKSLTLNPKFDDVDELKLSLRV